jgi:hypothetical protein
MAPIPRPGDMSPGFMVEEGRCFRLVYSSQLQSMHCPEPVRWCGRWKDAKDRVRQVWACEAHVRALEGVRSAA